MRPFVKKYRPHEYEEWNRYWFEQRPVITGVCTAVNDNESPIKCERKMVVERSMKTGRSMRCMKPLRKLLSVIYNIFRLVAHTEIIKQEFNSHDNVTDEKCNNEQHLFEKNCVF
jgi:hypothetical protein